jgi:endonuclease YncB( thermonuclease family)
MAGERIVSDEWRFRARVLDAPYDGDTFKVVMRLGMRQTCGEEEDPVPVRLDGLDTPEVKSKNPATAKLAQKARAFVAERLVAGPYLLLYPRKASKVVFDKYGRLLCTVYYQRITKEKVGKKVVERVEWINLNEELLSAGLAKRYGGGKKDAWEDDPA